MSDTTQLETVNIRPGVSMLSVLKALNYRPWFALAEFVDNAIQSFLDHREDLEALHDGPKLHVEIVIDPADGGRITIRDNAAGIYEHEYARAFRPAEFPPDRSGLCEFGMGMKNAACWFSSEWLVRTKALGEPIERTITFNIDDIVRDSIEELGISSRPAEPRSHYTEIILSRVYKVPRGNTIKKMKSHLAGMYRIFIREGTMELSLNGEDLSYVEPEILETPAHDNPAGPPVLWSKPVDFDFGQGQRVTGFAALREVGSIKEAGLALFRRKRLIQGSSDETYRPSFIFGNQNSFAYQRLFGELTIEGIEVSHTKDGFLWGEEEEPFLELLKERLDQAPLQLLRQAKNYRVRAAKAELEAADVDAATERTTEAIGREASPIIDSQRSAEPETGPPASELPETEEDLTSRDIELNLNDQRWKVTVKTTRDPAVWDWISVSDSRGGSPEQLREITVQLSLSHPFTDNFWSRDEVSVEAFIRIAAAIGLAQIAARDSGATMSGTIVRNFNDLLRDGLSVP